MCINAKITFYRMLLNYCITLEKMNPSFDSNPPSDLLKFRYIYYGQVGGEDECNELRFTLMY